MRAKKLSREAVVKRYTPQQSLEHAANKQDVDRQAQDMDQKFAPDQDRVKRIRPKKTHATARRQEQKHMPILL